MAERSFKNEVEHLRKGDGDVFTGEGILALTKALLENGVGYVGGYQGAPISHLMDVLADAEDVLRELGVRFEANASEGAAAAMLAASVHYPIRGAVTFKGRRVVDHAGTVARFCNEIPILDARPAPELAKHYQSCEGRV
jgi:indolepyruvate ferredoxin oxidoreductase alpha subunit